MKLLLLNPTAGGGRARTRWSRIEPRVRALLPDLVVRVAGGPGHAVQIVREALDRGVMDFVAAGGDGMVNLLVSAIATSLSTADLGWVRIGAIGLGSSNDFHKPYRDDRMLDGVPYRLDFETIVPQDVCVAALGNGAEPNGLKFHHWMINASVGITAEANFLFNHPDRLLSWLKRTSTGLGIAYAALRTVLSFKGHRLRVEIDGDEWSERVLKNIGVVKNPHFSGTLCYDSPHEPASGGFHVHMLEGVSLPATLRILNGLTHQRFSGLPGTLSRRARELKLSSTEPFAVELDGEVVKTRFVRMAVLSQKIGVCT